MKKTLIILTPGFPASETDMNCLPMQQDFVRTLKRIYPELEIIILSFQYPYNKKRYDWYGNAVISFTGKNKGGFSKLFLRKKINTVLKDIQKAHKIIALLSFWYNECAFIGNRFADKYGLKHFCWLLGQDARKANDYVRKIKPQPVELIALSDFLQDEFEKNHGIRPAHVIPPGIDQQLYAEKNLERDIDLLGVGSLIPLKQYDTFLEIVFELKKVFPGIKAVLCGNGPEENKLQFLVKELGLRENVRMTGEILHHEVLLLMQRSKILMHPSSYEGFSGVCMEALYGGAHAISFCRAMKIEISQWHIVPSKDEMKKKALEILQEPSIKFETVLPYKMEDTARKMMELFTS